MRIFRYLSGDVLSHTGAVALVLFLVVFSGRFIKYLAEAATGDLAADILLPVMLYKLPSFFELILPLALFIGILLSLGRLYADSEMVVLRACGVGPWRLLGYLFLPVLLVTSLVAGLSLYLAPEGSSRAQALLDDPNATEGIQTLVSGRFKTQQGGKVVTYAETIDADGVMHNVFVVEGADGGERSMTLTQAAEGEVKYDAAIGRRYLELRHGTRYRGVPGAPDYEAMTFERYGELIPEQAGSLRARIRTEAIPTLDLWGSEAPRERATLVWRISLPIIVPIITLIAVALSRTDSRRGRYARLGPALVLFLAYFIALTQTRSIIESGGSSVFLVLAHTAFLFLAIVLLQWEAMSKKWSGGLRGKT